MIETKYMSHDSYLHVSATLFKWKNLSKYHNQIVDIELDSGDTYKIHSDYTIGG